MLVQFTVGNFLSFKEKTTFSMVASPDEPGHEDRVVKINENLRVLRVAAIYGANASGKSNLLKAMEFARNLIVNGTRAGERIIAEPFLLDQQTKNQPSHFEFVFYWDDLILNYGFTCNSTLIHTEWLRDATTDESYFERTSEDNNVIISFNPKLINEKKERLEFIREGTRPNQLFFVEAAQRNIGVFFIFSIWFTSKFNLRTNTSHSFAGHLNLLEVDHTRRGELGLFLKKADTGIDNISVIPTLIQPVSTEIATMVSQILSPGENGDVVFSDSQNQLYFLRRHDNILYNLALEANHKGTNLPWSKESEGTRRLANIWQLVFLSEGIWAFDELDQSLHPEMVRFFLEQWLEREQESSQLIFTTHNDNLLEDDLLRRDEVWFVTKNKEGASEMASLVEYKVAPGTNIQKAYLHGWYDGVPRTGARRFYHTIRESSGDADSSS